MQISWWFNMTAEAFTSRMCFVHIFVLQVSASHSVQEHQADVLLDTDAQIRELSFQETVEAYPCRRNGGSGRNNDPQEGKTRAWFFVRSENQDDTFLRGGQRNDENLVQDETTCERWTNIRRMKWHRKKFEDDLQAGAAHDERPSLLNRGDEEGWIWTFLLVFALDTACVLAFSVWRFRLRGAPAQFSSWIVSCPFKSLHYWLQLCDVLKCECNVLHIWFEHGSWTAVRRTCWGDQHSRDP